MRTPSPVNIVDPTSHLYRTSLLRWRSDAMRPYQDQPQCVLFVSLTAVSANNNRSKQLAFILNLEQHWFTLRRFGLANPDGSADQSHWFNLNSFLSEPEWVGKLYLGMVLQQAETEGGCTWINADGLLMTQVSGYSVFVVTPADPSIPLAVPQTEADNVAATLPEGLPARQSGIRNATKRTVDISGSSRNVPGSSGPLGSAEDAEGDEDIEDGDYELQAALHASLGNQEDYISHASGSLSIPPSLAPDDIPPLRSFLGAANRFVPTGPSQPSQLLNIPGHADLDPVAASMERNRVLLQRMREQQEYVHRELQSADGLTPEAQAEQEARRLERRRQEEEEEEQLRKAIAESEATARNWDAPQNQPNSAERPPLGRGVGTSSISPSNLRSEFRSYDDEDAELQAALKASLESAPTGWEPSTQDSTQERPKHPETLNPQYKRTEGLVTVDKSSRNTGQNEMDIDEEWHSESEDFSDGEDDDDDDISEMNDAPMKGEQSTPTLDEIRKARLARFGS